MRIIAPRYLIYTWSALGHEPHNHRFLASGHEAEAQRGTPMQHHQPRFRRGVIVVVALRFLVGGGFVQMADGEGKEEDKYKNIDPKGDLILGGRYMDYYGYSLDIVGLAFQVDCFFPAVGQVVPLDPVLDWRQPSCGTRYVAASGEEE